MSEAERKVRAFADALVALCKEHGVAIVNQDENGMAFVPFPYDVKTPGLFDVATITPNGVEGLWPPPLFSGVWSPKWEEDGHL